jgi:hypothetical protein
VQNREKIIIFLRRFYVLGFNIYAWFWLFRLIFFEKSTNIESYILWFFTTAGMYFFVLDGNDEFLKKIHRNERERKTK